MMGLGPLGNGGPSASSPSILSALAPPFTVDRSNQKPNSRQLLQFSDSQSLYAMPFDNNWACSCPSASTPLSTSLLDLDTDSIRMTCLPLSDDYHFPASESVCPPAVHWPTSNPTGQSMTNAFLYSCDSPYPGQDASPAVNDTTHMASINYKKYDMSPTPGLVRTNLFSPLDYTRRLSGIGYTSQWGSFWNGLAGDKQGKLIELDGSTYLDQKTVSDSLVYKNNMNQGIHTAEVVTQNEEVSAVLWGKCSDAFGSENYEVSLNAMQLDDQLLLEQDTSLIPFGSSTSTSRTHSTMPYSHPKAPSLDSVINSSQYVTYEKCFEVLDPIQTNCISLTKFAPTLVIRPPTTVTISSRTNIVSSKTVDTVSVISGKSGGCDSQNFSKEKDPLILQSTECKEGCLNAGGVISHKERNNHIHAGSSTIGEWSNKKVTVGNLYDPEDKSGFQDSDLSIPADINAGSSTIGEWSNKKVTVGNLYDTEDKSGFQDSDLSIPADLSLPIDTHIDSTDNSTDSLDHLNTGVDSPCWKGVPGLHFSPFEVATTQLFTNRLETCNTLNLQGTKTFPPHSQPMISAPQKQRENSNLNKEICAEGCFSLSQKRCSDAIETAEVNRLSDVEESRNNNIKGVHFSEYIEKPNNFSFISEPKNDCEPSHFRKLRLEEGNSTSTGVKKIQDYVAEGVIKTTDVTEAGQFPTVKNVSCLLSFKEDATDFAIPHGRESTPKLDVQMLVQTMCNLSEFLQFHCSVNSRPLEGHEHETLKIVMDNLQACMSKKIVDATWIPESIVPQESTHFESLPEQYMCPSICQTQVTNKAPAISLCQCMHEGKDKYNPSVNETAIMAVRDENFQIKDEVESQILLYKNLWLEAEAELCAINYRARHDRMKIEMKKSKLKKERAETKHAHLSLETARKESTASGATSHVDEEEASAMTRLRILECLGENSKFIDKEEKVPTLVNTGSAGERSQRPYMGDELENGIMKVAAKPHLHHEQETIEEFRICIPDNEPMVPFARNNAQPIRHTPSCCYDNTTSDWEHVLKDDDYALQ